MGCRKKTGTRDPQVSVLGSSGSLGWPLAWVQPPINPGNHRQEGRELWVSLAPCCAN